MDLAVFLHWLVNVAGFLRCNLVGSANRMGQVADRCQAGAMVAASGIGFTSADYLVGTDDGR